MTKVAQSATKNLKFQRTIVQVGDIDQIEAAQHLPRFGERTVGHQSSAFRTRTLVAMETEYSGAAIPYCPWALS
jgi:hypothetical protein